MIHLDGDTRAALRHAERRAALLSMDGRRSAQRRGTGDTNRGRRGGGGAGAFDPRQYASVIHWLRSDDVTLDGSNVSQWNDKSGNARHWTQGVGSVQPGWLATDPLASDKPCVTFDATATQYFDGWNMGALNPAVVESFLVLRIYNNPPASSLRRGLWNTNFAANDALYPHTTGIRDNLGSSALKLSTLPAVQTLLNTHVYGVNAQAGEWTSRLNGVQHFTQATNTMLWNAAPWLGRSTTSDHFDGRMYEWILLAEKLTAPVRAIFHAYFAARYAVSVTP